MIKKQGIKKQCHEINGPWKLCPGLADIGVSHMNTIEECVDQLRLTNNVWLTWSNK
jgi:hypothetical protein